MTLPRRQWLAACASLSLSPLATSALAQTPPPAQSRGFDPRPGAWRGTELITQLQVRDPRGRTVAWVPLPSVQADDWQRVDGHQWSGNARRVQLLSDGRYGARLLRAEFEPGTPEPTLRVTSQVWTRDRRTDWDAARPAPEAAQDLRTWLQPTELMPTDGIVRRTALQAVGSATNDRDKVQALYDWVVSRTYREPKVRGCGTGDVKTMLETENFGGKCGDINGLFVALCRAAGIPARDVYGIRTAPSAFGWRELGANPARLQAAQHCRAEVHLQAHGWVPMDPADVGKVMRQETPEWIRDPAHPFVQPVRRGLFGGWEGNWVAYNTAHDVKLPGSSGPALGFLMYPQVENDHGRYDPLDPDGVAYLIQSRALDPRA
ncbi:transglutaminase family protein [Aquabacterium sp. J223]|uniref:transglutaminase-like domain-containing protein n=1 Tax=Aquabacterium sp. J223 TaxID=2898431 RepID=UPI0021ADA01A|nr:transglutaminase family protein [Aquabacterium sp. J223]UUX96006.1 transglutaminase family protein [Aquabacterium sp. J223]